MNAERSDKLLRLLLDSNFLYRDGLWSMRQWTDLDKDRIAMAHWSGASAIPLMTLWLLARDGDLGTDRRLTRARIFGADGAAIMIQSIVGSQHYPLDDRAYKGMRGAVPSVVRSPDANAKPTVGRRDYLSPDIVRFNDDTIFWFLEAMVLYRRLNDASYDTNHRFVLEFCERVLDECSGMLPLCCDFRGNPVNGRPYERRELRELPTTVGILTHFVAYRFMGQRSENPAADYRRFDRTIISLMSAIETLPGTSSGSDVYRFWDSTGLVPAWPTVIAGVYTITHLACNAAETVEGGGRLVYSSRAGDALNQWGVPARLDWCREMMQLSLEDGRARLEEEHAKRYTLDNALRWLQNIWPEAREI